MSRFTKKQVEAAEKDLKKWRRIKAAKTTEDACCIWASPCNTCLLAQSYVTPKCSTCIVYITKGTTCKSQGWQPLADWLFAATEENRATMQKGADWIIAICNEVIAEGYNDEL